MLYIESLSAIPMKAVLRKRLQSLKTEQASGQKVMADLEAQQANLQATLLRISGAIQVLEEVLNEESDDPSNIPANGVAAAET